MLEVHGVVTPNDAIVARGRSQRSGSSHSVGDGVVRIGLALVAGIWVRLASAFGLLYMLTLLFSSNYPGTGAPLWEYFGAALNHLVLALCFLTFLGSRSDAVLSVRRWSMRSSS